MPLRGGKVIPALGEILAAGFVWATTPHQAGYEFRVMDMGEAGCRWVYRRRGLVSTRTVPRQLCDEMLACIKAITPPVLTPEEDPHHDEPQAGAGR
jgi:hypothetical protein